jgi:hypothetical protein
VANSYLQRRNARIALGRLKREIVFGMVTSLAMLGIGVWRYFIVIEANDVLWSVVALLGGVGLLVSLVVPWLWKGPETWLTAVGGRVGSTLFSVLLTVVYGLLMSPIGWILRRMNGTDPIYAWDTELRVPVEGWREKEVVLEANAGGRGKPSVLRRFVSVLHFFARRGHYVFLPSLVILLALGVVLFFVKTTALAPLIYTLF